MEIANVKRSVTETIERARRRAAERRTRNDQAARAYETFLEQTAVPLFRQLANVLRIQGYPFTVFTPAGAVRLMSDRASEDYIELVLDSSGDEARVTGRVGHSRGRRVVESERAIGDPSTLTEDDVLAFVLTELEPFVER